MIVAVTMARDEADVIAETVTHLHHQGVDTVIVADNLSNDGTGDLARDAGAVVLKDDDPAHRQGHKMTHLANVAAGMGAAWVLPFDADELWYGVHLQSISEALRGACGEIVEALGWDHIATKADRPVHPYRAMVHRRLAAQKFPKVAFRPDPAARLGEGNHTVDRDGLAVRNVLKFRHFQWRSPEQMVRKVRQGAQALRDANMAETTGAHWRHYDAMSDEQIVAEFWALGEEPGLILDPASP